MKENSANNQTIFSRIAFVSSLLLIIGVFPQFRNEFHHSIYNFIYDLLAIVTLIAYCFWIRNRVTLIGLLLYVIGWNIKLLVFSFTRTDIPIITDTNLFLLAMILRGTGAICVMIGILNIIKIKYWADKINLNSKVIFGSLLGFTVIFQLVFRIL